VSQESRLGDILRRYWDSLPERVKKLAAEEQELYLAYLALDESLRPHAVPSAIREQTEGGQARRVLTLMVSGSLAQMALKSRIPEFRERLRRELGVEVEVEVYLRPDDEVKRVRKRLTGE